MTTGSLLFSLALLLLVGVYIARPFLLPAARAPQPTQRQRLLARQEALLAQIQALDFDVETGKVLPEDHHLEREHMLHEAAEVMAELEATAATPAHEAIEASVRALRQLGHTCPHCGAAVGSTAKFCATCGKPLDQQGSIALPYLLTLAALTTLSLSLSPSPALSPSQTLPPPTADPTNGLTIYTERCAVCHGTTGMGDGSMASQALLPPTQFGRADYWETAEPLLLFESIRDGRMAGGMPGFGQGNNSNPLSESQIWDVVAALATLPNLNQPIATAAVQGQVTNRTTGAIVGQGVAILQAFTPDFEEGLRLEEPLTAEGTFFFPLSNVPPQWFYRVVVQTAEGLEFGSEFGQLSPQQPVLALNVATYEPTRDEGVLAIGQLDVFLEFGPTGVAVSELYTIDNHSNAIFVGSGGNFRAGTVRLTVPPTAENVVFWRGMGGASDFVPADTQMVQLDSTTWAFARPVSAGQEVVQLVVRYELPYNGRADINHPVPYPVGRANLFVPRGAVAVAGNTWQATTSPVPNFDQYQRPPLAAGQPLEIALRGHPAWVTDSAGNLIPNRNAQQELWWGIGALGLVVVGAGYSVWRWRNSPPPTHQRDALLQALADLDDAYAQKAITKRVYEQQRQALKEQLLGVWDG